MTDKSLNGVTITPLKKDWMITTFEDNCLLNAQLLEQLRDLYNELNGSEDLTRLRLIQVFEGRIQVTRDIGERYLTSRIRTKIGEALVTTHPNTKQYLSGASAIMRRTHPVRVFETIDEAKSWLENL